MIRDIGSPREVPDDAFAWEGVVVDPDGWVERAIHTRAAIRDAIVLELGRPSLRYALRHADFAVQVYAAPIDGPTEMGSGQTEYVPAHVNAIRFDAVGLPLRDEFVDVAIIRQPYFGGNASSIDRIVTEALRTLKWGGLCFVVSLNCAEGDLGALIEAMSGAAQEAGRCKAVAEDWKERSFQHIRVPTQWRAPGRTILRRVLTAEFSGLPNADLAGQVAVSELSCVFDVFWKIKEQQAKAEVPTPP